MFSLRYGNGKVYSKSKNKYYIFPILVQFECVIGNRLMSYSFTKKGSSSEYNTLPDLYSGHVKGDYTRSLKQK